jgi:hypothetical protein
MSLDEKYIISSTTLYQQTFFCTYGSFDGQLYHTTSNVLTPYLRAQFITLSCPLARELVQLLTSVTKDASVYAPVQLISVPADTFVQQAATLVQPLNNTHEFISCSSLMISGIFQVSEYITYQCAFVAAGTNQRWYAPRVVAANTSTLICDSSIPEHIQPTNSTIELAVFQIINYDNQTEETVSNTIHYYNTASGTSSSTSSDSNNLIYIITGSIAGGLVFFVLIYYLLRRSKDKENTNTEPLLTNVTV